MNNLEIIKTRNSMRDHFQSRIEFVANETEKVISAIKKEYRVSDDSLLARINKKRCENCDGTGAVERIDSGYMRRFNLREWNGCVYCGGNGNDIKGCGFRTVMDD